jgi:hypothetical protein
MADVDLAACAGTGLNLIGYFREARDCQAFTGVFDGGGHRILNFTYQSQQGQAAGLFVYVGTAEARIENVTLVDPNLDAPDADLVGSLVGYLQQGTISNCHALDSRVSGHFDVGGLVGGCENATIADSSAEGQVRGRSGVGGLVGHCDHAEILGCRSAGMVVSHDSVGGLVGGADFSVTTANCYSHAGVAGDLYVGGLAGSFLSGSVVNCYSTGAVSGGTMSGGLIGFRGAIVGGPFAEVTGCFWDSDTSGQPASDGGTGRTTAQMQRADTFLAAGWDFVDETANGIEDLWWMQEGQDYPRLAWEQKPADASENRADAK